jgi:phospholipase C
MKWISMASTLPVLFATTLAFAQIEKFAHIVIIVQENRTPDNLFQGLCAPPFGSAKSCATTGESDRDDSVRYEIQTRD